MYYICMNNGHNSFYWDTAECELVMEFCGLIVALSSLAWQKPSFFCPRWSKIDQIWLNFGKVWSMCGHVVVALKIFIWTSSCRHLPSAFSLRLGSGTS